MNGNIYVNEQQLNIVIENLKQQRNSLKNVLDKQINNINEMKKYWTGTSGDKAYETLVKHKEKYSSYISSMDEKITFLEQIRNSYKRLDTGISNTLDNNVEIQA